MHLIQFDMNTSSFCNCPYSLLHKHLHQPVLVLHFLLDVLQHVGGDVPLQVLRQLLRGVFQVLLVVLSHTENSCQAPTVNLSMPATCHHRSNKLCDFFPSSVPCLELWESKYWGGFCTCDPWVEPPLGRIFPVEEIFPFEWTCVLTHSFEWACKPRSSLCTHAFHRMDSKDPDIHVLERWMLATKTHPACTIHKDGMWILLWKSKFQQVFFVQTEDEKQPSSFRLCLNKTLQAMHIFHLKPAWCVWHGVV